MKWNAEVDVKLLLAFLKVHEFKWNLDAVAADLGSGCTGKAVSHRIAKLKKDAAGGSVGSNVAASATATPQRRGATANGPPASSKKGSNKAKGGKKVKKEPEDDDGQDEHAKLTVGDNSTSMGFKRSYADDSDNGDDDNDGNGIPAPKMMKFEDSGISAESQLLNERDAVYGGEDDDF